MKILKTVKYYFDIFFRPIKFSFYFMSLYLHIYYFKYEIYYRYIYFFFKYIIQKIQRIWGKHRNSNRRKYVQKWICSL